MTFGMVSRRKITTLLHSKAFLISPHFPGITFCALLLLYAGNINTLHAQSLDARISIVSLSPARVKVEGVRASSASQWSFRNAYAGIIGLGERIENLRLADAAGANVPVQKLAPGEYEATGAAERFTYDIRLEAPVRPTDAAYISWLTNERGCLMLGDLLPRATGEQSDAITAGVKVRFDLPPKWTVTSSETGRANNQFETPVPERAVFLVGKDWRERVERVGPMDLTFVTAGDWAFADQDAAGMAASILKDHTETVGGAPRGRVLLMLSPFSQPVSAEHWSAETRGSTVMLLMGRSPSRTAALAQLGGPLAHELFHLWVPNGLALDGDYDWFYEGFTGYQAMRAGMRLHLLTFQDYLNTLGRSFDAYRAVSGRDQMSLIDASQRRWTTATALIYNKGMLVAFLYDLTLRRQTGGRRSLDDVYRELFRRYPISGARANGNTAVIATLSRLGAMQGFVQKYILKASLIDLESAIAPFGLRTERSGARTRVVVADSLSRPQRDLLRQLGYNIAASASAKTRAE